MVVGRVGEPWLVQAVSPSRATVERGGQAAEM